MSQTGLFELVMTFMRSYGMPLSFFDFFEKNVFYFFLTKMYILTSKENWNGITMYAIGMSYPFRRKKIGRKIKIDVIFRTLILPENHNRKNKMFYIYNFFKKILKKFFKFESNFIQPNSLNIFDEKK